MPLTHKKPKHVKDEENEGRGERIKKKRKKRKDYERKRFRIPVYVDIRCMWGFENTPSSSSTCQYIHSQLCFNTIAHFRRLTHKSFGDFLIFFLASVCEWFAWYTSILFLPALVFVYRPACQGLGERLKVVIAFSKLLAESFQSTIQASSYTVSGGEGILLLKTKTVVFCPWTLHFNLHLLVWLGLKCKQTIMVRVLSSLDILQDTLSHF